MIKTFLSNLQNKFKKTKKYIIKYEEVNDKIKIYNSNNEYRYIENTIPNKIKIIEIIKDHKEEINTKINYYDIKKDDYKIIFIINELILLFLGCIFLFSFFIGESLLFIMSLIMISVYSLIFINYAYRILLFRSEIKKLKNLYVEETKINLFDKIKNIKINLNTYKNERIVKNS